MPRPGNRWGMGDDSPAAIEKAPRKRNPITPAGSRASIGEKLGNAKDAFSELLLSNKKRKIGTGVAALLLWSAASYDKPLHVNILPTPTKTADGAVHVVADVAGWLLTRVDAVTSSKDSKPHNSSSPVIVTSPSSPSLTTAMGNPTNLVPVTSPESTSTSIASSSTTQQEVLPAVVQYSEAAGSVVCDGPIVIIHIDPNGKPKLIQMREQTGEPWDQGTPNSKTDAQLYAEASQGRLVFPVRTHCSGLEN